MIKDCDSAGQVLGERSINEYGVVLGERKLNEYGVEVMKGIIGVRLYERLFGAEGEENVCVICQEVFELSMRTEVCVSCEQFVCRGCNDEWTKASQGNVGSCCNCRAVGRPIPLGVYVGSKIVFGTGVYDLGSVDEEETAEGGKKTEKKSEEKEVRKENIKVDNVAARARFKAMISAYVSRVSVSGSSAGLEASVPCDFGDDCLDAGALVSRSNSGEESPKNVKGSEAYCDVRAGISKTLSGVVGGCVSEILGKLSPFVSNMIKTNEALEKKNVKLEAAVCEARALVARGDARVSMLLGRDQTQCKVCEEGYHKKLGHRIEVCSGAVYGSPLFTRCGAPVEMCGAFLESLSLWRAVFGVLFFDLRWLLSIFISNAAIDVGEETVRFHPQLTTLFTDSCDPTRGRTYDEALTVLKNLFSQIDGYDGLSVHSTLLFYIFNEYDFGAVRTKKSAKDIIEALALGLARWLSDDHIKDVAEHFYWRAAKFRSDKQHESSEFVAEAYYPEAAKQISACLTTPSGGFEGLTYDGGLCGLFGAVLSFVSSERMVCPRTFVGQAVVWRRCGLADFVGEPGSDLSRVPARVVGFYEAMRPGLFDRIIDHGATDIGSLHAWLSSAQEKQWGAVTKSVKQLLKSYRTIKASYDRRGGFRDEGIKLTVCAYSGCTHPVMVKGTGLMGSCVKEPTRVEHYHERCLSQQMRAASDDLKRAAADKEKTDEVHASKKARFAIAAAEVPTDEDDE